MLRRSNFRRDLDPQDTAADRCGMLIERSRVRPKSCPRPIRGKDAWDPSRYEAISVATLDVSSFLGIQEAFQIINVSEHETRLIHNKALPTAEDNVTEPVELVDEMVNSSWCHFVHQGARELNLP